MASNRELEYAYEFYCVSMVPSRIIDWIDALKKAQGPILNKCFMGYSLTIKFE